MRKIRFFGRVDFDFNRLEFLFGGIALFVAIEKEEEQESLLERLKDLFKPPEVERRKVEVPGALPFYVLRVKPHKGAFPTAAVEEAAGALRARVLLPKGVRLPSESGLSVFEPSVFFERLLFNTAVDAIEKMQLEPFRVSVCVFDENAYLLDLVENLIPLAFELRVITNCVTAYEQLSKLFLERHGLSLIVSSRADDSVLSSTFVVSASAKAVPLIFPGVLFTNKRRKFMNAVVVCGEGFELDEKFAALLPEKIDPLRFAGALYELCGADELGKKRFSSTITL